MLKNKSILFSAPWKVEIIRSDYDLGTPSEYEIIIRNLYSLISAGTELACLSGNEPWFALPGIPGYNCVGEIIQCGKNVTDYEEGDFVITFCPHTQYVKVNTKNDFCVKIKDDIDLKHATFVRMGSIAITSLRVSNIELGDFVCVIGLGIIGNLAAQFSQLQGGNVTGVDLDEKRLILAEKCGIKSTKLFNASIQDEVMKVTSEAGFSTLIDASGSSQAIINSLPLVAKNGEIILLGTPRNQHTADITQLLRNIHMDNRNIVFKGANEWIYPIKPTHFYKHSFVRNAEIILNLIKEKRFKIEPLLTHVIKPKDSEKAYLGLRDKKNEYIGVIIDWKE